MADNKITQTNSRFLYETAAAATPTTWVAIGEGYTWSDDGRLFRVTADEPQFDATAYVAQRTNESGEYEDEVTIALDVPEGDGLSRVDVFTTEVVTASTDYTTLSRAQTFSRASEQDRIAHEQQVDLEAQIGIIFDYTGSKYRGTVTSRTDSKEFEPGGYLEGFEASVTTSRQQRASASVVPIIGARVTVARVKYRIGQIIKNGAHYQFNLTKQRGS